MTGNVGEWSELYVLLKLLADGKLYAADANIEKIASLYYTIFDIQRRYGSYSTTYQRKEEHQENYIVIYINEVASRRIPIANFSHFAELLHASLLTPQRSKGAFELPEIWSFAEQIHCVTLKATSTDKADIHITVHDARTGSTPTLGFSIKSQIAGASTLLNASLATSIVYRLVGPLLTPEQCNTFSLNGTFRNRFAYLDSLGGQLQYDSLHPTFAANLALVDSRMPELLASLVERYYRGRGTTISELTELCVCDNPLSVIPTTAATFYPYKVKELLTNIALGMVPATLWNGHYAATGGFIIVKRDGDVLCYHIYNRNEFREYLFKNTKFDTPSTSRHGFGTIKNDTYGQYIELNAQIRFIQ